ncbi:MAG TPA: hypothetical protein VIZ28_19440 [Chitinophagaceae bacterium]
MKTILFAFALFISVSCAAQNVGIGTTTPEGRLQVNHRSTTAVGLKLVDSSASSAGTVEFRNVNNTKRMLMSGYTESDFNIDQYIDVTSDSAFVATFRGSGMVGIRTGGPQFPLDVNGDINTNGAVRVNGNAGTNGQILRSNGDGTMNWADVSEYKNFEVFNFTTTGAVQNWSVPASVTKIKVELWGGGGYGTYIFLGGVETSGAGGGGGGYITGYFAVTGGSSVSVVVGGGGSVGVNGGNSRVDVGIRALIANGGTNGVYNGGATRFDLGTGGSFSAINTTNYFGLQGQGGYPTTTVYEQKSATDFVRKLQYGNGGNAGNTINTGGIGGYDAYNSTTLTSLQRTNGTVGHVPGGGGASIGPAGSGATGGNGMVIIYY